MEPGPRPTNIKPFEGYQNALPANTQEESLEVKLQQAKKKEALLHEKMKEVIAKQTEAAQYDFLTDTAFKKLNDVENYEEQFEKFLDDKIVIDPSKMSNEMISFADIGEQANAELVNQTGIWTLGAHILNYYARSENPLRRFGKTQKEETTLRKLFNEFTLFLKNQILIEKPTGEEIDEIQDEYEKVFAEHKRAQDIVKSIESQIKSV